MPTPFRYVLTALSLVLLSDAAHAQCGPGQTPVFGNFGGISCKAAPKLSVDPPQRVTVPSSSQPSSGNAAAIGAAGALIGAGTNAAAAIFGRPSGAPSPDAGPSGYEGAMGAAQQYAACAEVFDQNVKESDARRAILAKIGDTDYDALCRFGHEIGHPGLQTALNRIVSSPVCDPADPIVDAVVKAQKKIIENNWKAIANDCRRAKTKPEPEPQSCGVVQGEKVVADCYTPSGSKSCYCIPLTNTCKKESKMKAHLSYKVSGVANGRMISMDPEETKLEACTTKEGSFITLGSYRLSRY